MRSIVVVFLCLAWSGAHAGVYKCNQGGTVVYSDKPCPGAKEIDTTNARAPERQDAYRARARALRDEAELLGRDVDKLVEKRQGAECDKMLRDYNWTEQTAAKYRDDVWWQNRVADRYEDLQAKCGKFLIPRGAGRAP